MAAKRCHAHTVIFPVRRRADRLDYRTDGAEAGSDAGQDAGQDAGPGVGGRDDGDLRRASARGRYHRFRARRCCRMWPRPKLLS